MALVLILSRSLLIILEHFSSAFFAMGEWRFIWGQIFFIKSSFKLLGNDLVLKSRSFTCSFNIAS